LEFNVINSATLKHDFGTLSIHFQMFTYIFIWIGAFLNLFSEKA